MIETCKMAETLVHGSTKRELSNEYVHDRVWMVFKSICFLMLRTKVASELKGLRVQVKIVFWIYDTFDNNFEGEL